MLAKCSCQYCQQPIEFEAEHANAFIECPNPDCKQSTRLIVPRANTFPPKPIPPAPKKWDLSQWFTFALVLFGIAVLIFFLCWKESRTYLIQTGGLMLEGTILCVIAGLLIYLAWILIRSGIVLQFIIWSLIAFGLYLFIDGFFTRQTVMADKEGTIFQQVYATIECVGGALVFCGAMILKVLRDQIATWLPIMTQIRDQK